MKRLPAVIACLIPALFLFACRGIAPTLPSAETLLQQHLRATYGEKSLDARKSVTFEGRLLIDSFDVNAPLTIKTEAPDKHYFETRLNDEKFVRTCTGGECWTYRAGDWSKLQGEELAFVAEAADFFRLTHLERYFKSLQTSRATRFNGEPAYEVVLTRPNGLEEQWYFARDNGLWLGGNWYVPESMGGMQVTQYFEDYQDFGGIKFATKITEVSPQQTSNVVIEDVSFRDIPDSTFAPKD